MHPRPAPRSEKLRSSLIVLALAMLSLCGCDACQRASRDPLAEERALLEAVDGAHDRLSDDREAALVARERAADRLAQLPTRKPELVSIRDACATLYRSLVVASRERERASSILGAYEGVDAGRWPYHAKARAREALAASTEATRRASDAQSACLEGLSSVRRRVGLGREGR